MMDGAQYQGYQSIHQAINHDQSDALNHSKWKILYLQ